MVVALNRTGPPVFVVGIPGTVGGAATKVLHLLKLLHDRFAFTVVATDPAFQKDAEVRRLLQPMGIPCVLLKQLPTKINGVALGICDKDFFARNRAQELKSRGLKVVWSNEMMWPFQGEEEAVKAGLVDRVLFASEFQARSFRDMYQGVPAFITGNYIDPEDYCWKERKSEVFSIGRLSRPDPGKYPLDFPVFYEELGLKEVRYRVMAWSSDLKKKYCWHRFGPEWELLPANKQSALNFLYSLDLFVYPLGHRVKESWGRAVVEAMLTGCVPIVPSGHQFHNFINPGETGFICTHFKEFKACVQELYENYSLRDRISKAASNFARESLCSADHHRCVWQQALSF